jgi:hypothetical protein
MRINYPAEFRLEVNRLEKEFLLSPQGKGWLLNSASRQDGTMMFADYRWAKGDYAKLPSFAADLLSRPLALLVAAGDPAALAAKAATPAVPVVFLVGGDPVQEGLVTSMNRPGTAPASISSPAISAASGWSCSAQWCRPRAS